jgi:hypothetical protein
MLYSPFLANLESTDHQGSDVVGVDVGYDF